MKSFLFFFCCGFGILVSSPALSDGGFAVVELFTSEGCSSCPPADQILMDLENQARKENLPVYVLGFHVDYWNYLGWEDPFSSAEFSKRQRQYAGKLKSASVYTPQVVVNGREGFGGYERQRLEQTVRGFLNQPAGDSIRLDLEKKEGGFLLSYHLSRFHPGDLLQAAVVEDQLQSDVKRGENAGRQLRHANAVRSFQTIAVKAADGDVFLDVSPLWDADHLSVIVFLQDPGTFHILSAAVVSDGFK